MSTCCNCEGTPPPQDPGACCYLGDGLTDETQGLLCDDTLSVTDCILRTCGTFQANKECHQVDCSETKCRACCDTSTYECSFYDSPGVRASCDGENESTVNYCSDCTTPPPPKAYCFQQVTSERLLGDFNNDGVVDTNDYNIWADNFGEDSAVLNGNGSGGSTVDQADYELWASNYGKTKITNASEHLCYKQINSWVDLGSETRWYVEEQIQGKIINGYFGASVSLSQDGTRLAVGSMTANDMGKVTVFDYNSTNPILPGDFNNDGIVDTNDYNIWRDNLGLDSAVLNGNGTGAATVVQEDYDLWRTNFGETRSEEDGWLQIGSDILGESTQGLFGESVSLSPDGTMLAIGASQTNTSTGSVVGGEVKIFEYNGSDWVQLGNTIRGLDGDGLGTTVSFGVNNIDDVVSRHVAIGSTWGNLEKRLQIYRYNGTEWKQIGPSISVDMPEGEHSIGNESVSISANGKRVALGVVTKRKDRGGIPTWFRCERILQSGENWVTYDGEIIDTDIYPIIQGHTHICLPGGPLANCSDCDLNQAVTILGCCCGAFWDKDDGYSSGYGHDYNCDGKIDSEDFDSWTNSPRAFMGGAKFLNVMTADLVTEEFCLLTGASNTLPLCGGTKRRTFGSVGLWDDPGCARHWGGVTTDNQGLQIGFISKDDFAKLQDWQINDLKMNCQRKCCRSAVHVMGAITSSWTPLNDCDGSGGWTWNPVVTAGCYGVPEYKNVDVGVIKPVTGVG